MHESRTFLQDLALVFCVATLAALLFQRLRQPVVLAYLVAGVIVGPHVPLPLFVDLGRIQTLSELGVILVMFSLGLEFSLQRLVRLLPTAGLAGLVQISAMLWLGYLVGTLFGMAWPANLFVGGMICISSTMIVARVFADQGVDEELAGSVFGILVIQDLAAIVLITMFTALASGAGLPAYELITTVGRLGVFVAAMIVVGILLVPRLVREAHRRSAAEVLLIASVGVCFGLALLAEHFGYSVALGAFVAGVLVGESGRRSDVAHSVAPLRDVFAAVFFVSVGMLVDPRVFGREWLLVTTLVMVVIVGQTLFISLGTFLAGKSVRLAIRTGLSLAQIGEFSFILVGIGTVAGVVPADLLAVAVGVAVVTTFLTPLLVRASDAAAVAVDARLPPSVQTFSALYGAWFESLTRREPRTRSRAHRLWLLYAADASLLIALVVAAAVGRDWLAAELRAWLSLPPDIAAWSVIGAAIVLIAPFAIGVVRVARALGKELAKTSLPMRGGGVDLGAAPRRAFVLALQLALVLLTAFPLVALSAPFLPLYVGATSLAAIVVGLGIAFWKSTTNLEEHVRASAQVVLEALDRQRHHAAPTAPQAKAIDLTELLPGLGSLEPRRIGHESPVVGKTLAELNLRGATGAIILAIKRPHADVVLPTGDERLVAGDIVSITGSQEALIAADRVLQGET